MKRFEFWSFCLWLICAWAIPCAAAEDAPLAEAIESRTVLTKRLNEIVQERTPLDQESLKVIQTGLKHEDYRARVQAANVAGVLAERFPDDRRLVEPLVLAIRNEHELMTLIALVRTLGEYRDSQAVEPLLLLFRKREPFWFKEDVEREVLSQDEVDAYANELLNLICSTLGKIGDRAAIPVLRKRLPEGRAGVVNVLTQLKDTDSVPAFLAMLPHQYPATDSERAFAISLARALAELNDEGSAEPLIEAYLHVREFPNVGRTLMQSYEKDLCRALGRTCNPLALQVLLKASLTYPVDEPQFWQDNPAVLGLAQGCPAVWPALHEWLSSDGIGEAQYAIATSVLHLLVKSETLQPPDWAELSSLAAMILKSSSPKQQKQLLNVVSLACAMDPQSHAELRTVVPELLSILKSNPDDDRLLEVAVQALGTLGDAASADVAAALLRHHSLRVQLGAVTAIASLKHPRALELVAPVLSHEVVELRLSAIRGMRHLTGLQAAQALSNAMKHESSAEVLRTCCWSLALIGHPAGGDAIAEALRRVGNRKPEYTVIVACLARLGDQRGLEELRKALASETTFERLDVIDQLRLLEAEALGMQRPRASQPGTSAMIRQSLLQFIQRRKETATHGVDLTVNLWATVRAVRHLGYVLDDPTVDLLLEWSSSSNAEIRMAAIDVLADSHDPRRVEPLARAMKDPHRPLRSMLVLKLRDSSEPRLVAGLMDALRDESPEVREAALCSLSETKSVEVRNQIADLAANDRSARVRSRAQLVMKKLAQ